MQATRNQMRPVKMISPVRKRSINVNGHRTGVSIEDEFWSALKEIAARKETALFELCSQIDKDRADDNLSSAVQLFILAYYIKRANGNMVAEPTAPTDL